MERINTQRNAKSTESGSYYEDRFCFCFSLSRSTGYFVRVKCDRVFVMVDVENFDDLLRDIAADGGQIDGGPIATKLLENQQLGFKLAEENRTLRHLLQDERQAKRLLSVTNANLESQLRKAEQRVHTLEQSLRIAENRRIEIVDKYENEV